MLQNPRKLKNTPINLEISMNIFKDFLEKNFEKVLAT